MTRESQSGLWQLGFYISQTQRIPIRGRSGYYVLYSNRICSDSADIFVCTFRRNEFFSPEFDSLVNARHLRLFYFINLFTACVFLFRINSLND